MAEVFAIAWRRLDAIPREAEVPWLIGVARNRVLNMRTKRGRRLRLTQGFKTSPASSPAAEDEVLAEMALREAIEKLPEMDRETLLLSVWEGLSPSDISTILGCSENAARIRLSRAKAQLLRLMAAEGPETDTVVARDTE
jgi:RNA polymerase sigma-70 factor (ECF subfamily)